VLLPIRDGLYLIRKKWNLALPKSAKCQAVLRFNN
jgi:hypothetical protein